MGRIRILGALALSLALLAAACGDDGGGDSSDATDTTDSADVDELLGPVDEATGEPVKIGMVSDGQTPAFDNTDELRAAEATAEYYNEHQAGVGGRPVEVVTCETGGEPAGATDCANQMVEEDVVAVALSQSAVSETLWEPLHAAGIPTWFFQASGEAIVNDDESSFLMFSPTSTLFSLPIAVAEAEDADKIDFITIDVPQALNIFQEDGPEVLDAAGLDYELIPVPVGTADMTLQAQEVADGGAGVVQVVGNDAFCIAAFNGLNTVGYDGAISSISQCITDVTRESVAGDVLEGINVSSTIALGATDDPTYQLYVAVMETYSDIDDVDNATAMGGYAAMASLLTALEGIGSDVTPDTVIETIRSMPEQEIPGGGGVKYQCGGPASEETPAVCTNQSLRTELDAEGEPTTYEIVNPEELLG